MKILHLLNSNKFSGAENVVCQIASMFDGDENIEIIYCSPDGPIQSALNERGIQFFPLKRMKRKELMRAIECVKPDVIHAHDMRASFFAATVCGKIPLISHIHNNNFNSRRLTIRSIAYFYAALKAKHIIWVSQSSYEGYLFHKRFSNKSSILYNIINPVELRKKIGEDDQTYSIDVIYVGRLALPKNPYRLLEISKLLIEKKPDIKIAVVGSGNMEEEIRKKSIEDGLSNNVHFWGFNPNPAKMLHDSKLMIMTSFREGTPMCALEAMALGVPIVSTPVDGVKNLVVNDWNGFLSDDNIELVDKIIEYLNDAQKLNYLRKNQVIQSEKWNSVENYKKTLLNIYYDERRN